MRRAAKRDASEPGIVQCFKAHGCEVLVLSQKGVPDLLVSWQDRLALVETKSAHGRLTPAQKEWHRTWKGRAHVVESVEQAFMVVGIPARLRT